MISIVIPVLDEELEIGLCLKTLSETSVPYEVLVVDGGSKDDTRRYAERGGARVLTSPRGRAGQMNRGAAGAEGEVLLFLHADMRLPPGGLDQVQAVMEDPAIPGGGFHKRYHPPSVALDGLAWLHNRIRADFYRDFVGTNALFVRRTVFEALGGFPDEPLLEDVLFSDRLKALGQVAVIPVPVAVSARKYQRDGVLSRTVRNLWIMFQFRVLGKTPRELVAQYR